MRPSGHTGDPIAPARIVCEFAKKNKLGLSIKGGVVEGSVLSAAELNGFGELPSKNALVASVLGTFLAPISSLAFVLDQARIKVEEGFVPAAAAAEEAPAATEAAAEAPAEAAPATEAPAEEA